MKDRHRLLVTAALTICGCLIAARGSADTLGEVLRRNGISAESRGTTDLDRSITSYAVENADDVFIVAYYWLPADSISLPDTIQLERLEKASGIWIRAALPRKGAVPTTAGTSWKAGSVLHIRHTCERLYLDTHGGPSAGTLLVLTRRLEPVTALDGRSVLVLENDIVIYEHSMVHFAPTHSAELWIYQPLGGLNVKMYPVEPYAPIRRQYIETVRCVYEQLGERWFRENNHHMDPERFNSDTVLPVFTDRTRTSVSFIMRFGDREVFPSSTPFIDVVVVCRQIESSRPQCSETELASLQQLRPGLSNLQILEEAVGRPGQPVAPR
jgi:hypothetical protein